MSLNPITDSIGVPVDVSGTGDLLIYAGQPGKIMRIFRVVLTLTRPDKDAYGDVVFKSGITPIPGTLQLKDGAIITLELNQRRWLMTGVGDDLNINLGIDGRLTGALTLLVETP